MAKKITAPHSYDPGKGRPKEYLAYLNEREMAYLRSINGNNMERGPRGLPSFPPEDAVGSSSKAGSKGPGGPSGPNSGPSRSGSPSTGGGGKGPGGPSGPNSGPSGSLGGGSKGAPGSSPSSPGGLRGAGGNYGPGSGRPGTTSSAGGGYKGPSSPMGGQGPSFSNDTKAQQNAQVRDAIKAVKNSPAFRNDASSGGIRTLNVGPIGTPVNVGPRVSPTQNRTSGPNNYNNIVTGGGGVMAYGGPMPKAPTRVSPTITPQKQFYERIAPGTTPSTSISSQFPSYKYSSPLTPGMTPEDMTRRGALMDQYEREIRDIMRGTPTSTGDPLRAGGIPTGGRSPGKTRGFSITSPAEAATPGPEEKVIEVEDFYRGRPTWAAGTYTPPYDAPSTAKNSKLFDDRLITTNGVTNEVPSEKINKMTPEDQKKLADSLQTPTYTPPKELRSAAGTYFAPEKTETDFTNSGAEIDVQPEDDVYGPKYVDPEVQEVMRDIDEKNRRGVKGMKATPGLGNILKVGDAIRGLITGKSTTESDADLKRAYMQGSPAQQAELEAKYPNLTKFAQQAGLEPRLPMSNYESWRQRSFGTGGGGGGSTSTTSPGGGITDIGSGGKNEPPRISPVEKEAPKPPTKPKEGGPRPSIYYKWDLGVDVPSPTDSDYTLYLKYLQEKAAAKAGFA